MTENEILLDELYHLQAANSTTPHTAKTLIRSDTFTEQGDKLVPVGTSIPFILDNSTGAFYVLADSIRLDDFFCLPDDSLCRVVEIKHTADGLDQLNAIRYVGGAEWTR